jgi:hypothetical protein
VRDFNIGEFSPRLDAEFFTTDYPELIQSGPPKPTLATLTENEGILFSEFSITKKSYFPTKSKNFY